MSVRTMARVWAHSQHGGPELLRMLAIADFADDEGNPYQAVDNLAEKCRMSARKVNRLLVGHDFEPTAQRQLIKDCRRMDFQRERSE